MSNDVTVLVNKIEQRKRFLARIHAFAEKVMRDFGRVSERTVHLAHTKVERVATNVGGFSFTMVAGQASVVSNSLLLHHGVTPVLSLSWQPANFSVEDCEVNFFDDSRGWRRALGEFMARYDKFLAEHKRQEAEGVVEGVEAKARQELHSKLTREVARLKI